MEEASAPTGWLRPGTRREHSGSVGNAMALLLILACIGCGRDGLPAQSRPVIADTSGEGLALF